MQNTSINYHGTFLKTSGISEATRSNFEALLAVNLKPNKINYIQNQSQFIYDSKNVSNIPNESIINIYHININDIESFLIDNTLTFNQNTYNIAYWAWEFNILPEQFIPLISLFDEIWVPSSFCQNVFSSFSFKPVIKIPHSITLTNSNEDPININLEGKFIFLSIFDSLSTPERKNTDGLINCFLESFKGNPEIVLILKTVNLEKNKRLNKKIHQLIECHPSIILINDEYSKQKLTQLIDLCDVYVSLHRAEGFGLTMAEAMLREKIVIATAYSGNMEFMSTQNSFLVDYELKTKTQDDGFLKQGYQYAEPNLNDAKELLKDIFENKNSKKDISFRAKKTIETYFSKDHIGLLMQKRLEKISLFMIENNNENKYSNNLMVIENIFFKNQLKKNEKKITKKISNFFNFKRK